MINTLKVRNFKSIKHLRLDCKRVNIFIGEPNAGKSNILESVGIFSLPHIQGKEYKHLRDFIRIESMTNLFYDNNLVSNIRISAGEYGCEVSYKDRQFHLSLVDKARQKPLFHISCNEAGLILSTKPISKPLPFKFYRFQVLDSFKSQEADYLLPPGGENLLTILITHKELRKRVTDFFREYGFRINLRQTENKIEVLKESDGTFIAYPYSLASDTLLRVVFHFVAMETNKDSIIIFEEPEAHAFPYYTKYLAENIAIDDSNQYFISTHNPYFLLAVLEKTPIDEIKIFITYYGDYQTKVRPLVQEELAEILEMDSSVFFNLERFLEKA